MVNRRQYIVQDGQNIYDVCVNIFGSVDGLLDLFLLNDGLELLPLYPGQVVYYIPKEVNANVLKAYTESSYVPATSSEMSPAPVPPPAPPADGVVISQFGLPDVTITAPGEFEVSPSRVEDDNGNIIQTLSPGQVYIDAVEFVTINLFGLPAVVVSAPGSYTVQPSTVKKNGVTIDTLSPGAEYIVPVETVTINLHGLQPVIVQAPGQYTVLPSLVKKNGETLAVLGPGQEYIVQPDSVTINYPNNDSFVVQAPATFNVEPSKVVNTLGQVIQELSPGDEYTVQGSGILYKRPIVPQRTSYRTGDTGWAYQNGMYDFSTDPSFPAVIQDLDYSDTTNFFFRLKHNNAFGNKFRYTNSLGVNNDPNGRIAGITFTGALNNYIIDHLTGFGYCFTLPGFATNWNNLIDQVTANRNSNVLGFNNWIPLTTSIVFQAWSLHFLSENPFGSTAFYLGDTQSSNTAQAWRMVTGNLTLSAKTTTQGGSYAFMRKHY